MIWWIWFFGSCISHSFWKISEMLSLVFFHRRRGSLELCGRGWIAVLYHPLHCSGHGLEGIKKQPQDRSALFCSIPSFLEAAGTAALRTLYLSCCCPSCPSENAAPGSQHIWSMAHLQKETNSAKTWLWSVSEVSLSWAPAKSKQTGPKQCYHTDLNQWSGAVLRQALQCLCGWSSFWGGVP